MDLKIGRPKKDITKKIHQNTLYAVVCNGAFTNHASENHEITQLKGASEPWIIPINHPYSLKGLIDRIQAIRQPDASHVIKRSKNLIIILV